MSIAVETLLGFRQRRSRHRSGTTPAKGRSANARKGEIVGRPAWTKRDKSTGEFMDVKKSKKKFKGVRREHGVISR
jgi:hypothetical protein